MKTFYTTRQINPSSNFHIVTVNNGVIVPDMVTPLHLAFEIISKDEVKRVKAEFGADSVSSFSHDSVFTPDYTAHIKTVKSETGIITRFFVA